MRGDEDSWGPVCRRGQGGGKTLRPPQSALHRNATVHGQRGPCLICCFQNLLGIKLIVALICRSQLPPPPPPPRPERVLKLRPARFLECASFCANRGSMPEKKRPHHSSRKCLYPRSPRTAEAARSPAGPLHTGQGSLQHPPGSGRQVFSQWAQPSRGEVSAEPGSRPLSLFLPGGEEGYK